MKMCLSGFRIAGWDDQAILNHAGVAPESVEEAYCSFDTCNNIFRAAEVLYGKSACIVSRLGMLPNSFQSLSLAMLSAPCFFEALQLNVKHGNSMSNGVDWFVVDDFPVVFGFKTHPDQVVIPAVAIAMLTMMVKTARFLYPKERIIKLVEVEQPEYEEDNIEFACIIKDYFKVPIKWGSGRYAVHYCEQVVKTLSITANHELMVKCENNWLEEVAGFEEASFLLKAQSFIRSNISNESLNIDSLARELNMSIRTLQRRLSLESTNYKRIVKAVRKKEALHLFQNPKSSVSEVAYALGFSDVTSLSRAFRRWFGKSPEQYRKSLVRSTDGLILN